MPAHTRAVALTSAVELLGVEGIRTLALLVLVLALFALAARLA